MLLSIKAGAGLTAASLTGSQVIHLESTFSDSPVSDSSAHVDLPDPIQDPQECPEGGAAS